MKKSIAFLLVITALSVAAQQPQTHTAPIYLVNAKYANGVAPGYAPTAGSGLTLNLGGGTVNCGGTIATYAAGTLTMAASATNYVYLNTSSSCVPAVKTSTFVAADIPIAVVVAGSSAITSITDDRTMFSIPGSGGGGSLPSCSDTSGSATAQSCSTSPSFTPVAGQSCVVYTTTTANTGSSLTVNVNSLGAKAVAKWLGTTTLAAGDVPANKPVIICYDGTNWDLATVGNAPTGGAFTGYLLIPPSGDTTCATDTSAISSAFGAAVNGRFEVGTYYVGTGSGTTFTVSNPTYWEGAGPATVLTKCPASTDLFVLNYQIPAGASTASGKGATFRAFDIQQKAGVTATGGSDFKIASASGAGNYVVNAHIENINSYQTYRQFDLETGAYLDWLKDNSAFNETGYCFYYNSPSPDGDIFLDSQNCYGVNVSGVVAQSDTFEISNLKANGGNLQLTSASRARIIDPSIEGISGGPTSCIDFGTGASSSNIQVVGGACGLSPITSVFGHLSNVSNLAYALDNYISGVTESFVSNWPATAPCPSGFQAYDNFNGSGPLSAHLSNCGQAWTSYDSISGDTGSISISNNTVSPGSTGAKYYLALTPSSANYTASLTVNVGAGSAVGQVLGRASTSAYTCYDVVFIDGTGVQLYKVISGTATQLGSTYSGITTGTHTIALNMNGTTISAVVDGTTQISVTDSSISAAGTVVIGLSNSSTTGYVFTVQ